MAPWNDQDLIQMGKKGITAVEADRQMALLLSPPPPPQLDRPATVGDGILKLSLPEQEKALELFEGSRLQGLFEKFVPSSGAASRMFFDMLKALNEFNVTRGELIKRSSEGKTEQKKLLEFFDHIHSTGFYMELEAALRSNGMDLALLLREGNYHEILQCLLLESGLNYSERPKGLVPFHRYEEEARTPVAEHLIEASLLVRDAEGTSRLHFTISPSHEEAFKRHIADLRAMMEKKGAGRFDIIFSFQKTSTDTLSLDERQRPLRDERGQLIFRPGGHGSLIENFPETRTPFLFIKNIDNVASQTHCSASLHWERVLGGLLIQLKTQADQWLKELENQPMTEKEMEDLRGHIHREWKTVIPKPAEAGSDLKSALRTFLNRPLRVCGVVPNTGEPGGGPFWVRNGRGGTSLQIVESSQVDIGNPAQADIFRRSTHFNPVDMACALRDDSGKPFDLTLFVDPQTVFLSRKSWRGKEIRALERPGLWNGAMAHWLTFFVEIPLETFHPVKTVFDLLKPSHRG